MFEAITKLFKSKPVSAAVELSPSAPSFPPVLCRLPGGRLAVIHHVKTDGYLGVRPITNEGRLFPNTSEHWSPEQRESIPEEYAVKFEDIIPLSPDEIPQVFR